MSKKDNRYEYKIGGDYLLEAMKKQGIDPKIKYPKVKQKKSFAQKVSSQFRDIKSKFKIHRKKDNMKVHCKNGDDRVTISNRKDNSYRDMWVMSSVIVKHLKTWVRCCSSRILTKACVLARV